MKKSDNSAWSQPILPGAWFPLQHLHARADLVLQGLKSNNLQIGENGSAVKSTNCSDSHLSIDCAPVPISIHCGQDLVRDHASNRRTLRGLDRHFLRSFPYWSSIAFLAFSLAICS